MFDLTQKIVAEGTVVRVAFAVLDVPRWTSAAMALIGRVVSLRNRAASASFLAEGTAKYVTGTATVGRLLTMDTYEGRETDPPSLHKYLYAHADSVNKVDPSGHDFTVAGITVQTGIHATLTTMTLVLVNRALIAQRGVDYRLYLGYNRAEIDAEVVARTDRVIAALTRIIESQGDRTFQQEGLVRGRCSLGSVAERRSKTGIEKLI